jgi:hypothetical protein
MDTHASIVHAWRALSRAFVSKGVAMQRLVVTAARGLIVRQRPDPNAPRIVAMPCGMPVETLDDILWSGAFRRIRAVFTPEYFVEGYSAAAFLAPLDGRDAEAPRPDPRSSMATPRDADAPASFQGS